jgi:hypothetical protein
MRKISETFQQLNEAIGHRLAAARHMKAQRPSVNAFLKKLVRRPRKCGEKCTSSEV